MLSSSTLALLPALPVMRNMHLRQVCSLYTCWGNLHRGHTLSSLLWALLLPSCFIKFLSSLCNHPSGLEIETCLCQPVTWQHQCVRMVWSARDELCSSTSTFGWAKSCSLCSAGAGTHLSWPPWLLHLRDTTSSVTQIAGSLTGSSWQTPRPKTVWVCSAQVCSFSWQQRPQVSEQGFSFQTISFQKRALSMSDLVINCKHTSAALFWMRFVQFLILPRKILLISQSPFTFPPSPTFLCK